MVRSNDEFGLPGRKDLPIDHISHTESIYNEASSFDNEFSFDVDVGVVLA